MTRFQRSEVRSQRSEVRSRMPDFGSRTMAGFTVLELLIVVVVIGILMAILMPAFQGARKKARDQETSSTTDAYNNARQAFRAEYGYYPGEELSPPQTLSQSQVITNYLLSNGPNNSKRISFWE